MDLFDLYARITLDTSGYEKSVNDAKKKTKDMSKSFDDAGDDANDLKRPIGDLKIEVKDVSRSANDASDGIDDMSRSMRNSQSAPTNMIQSLADVKAGFDIVIQLAAVVVTAVSNVVQSFFDLADSTEPFRENQAKLKTAFESAGFTAEQAQSAYKGLFAILGDNDQATEASQLLANLAGNAEDLTAWTSIAAGVYGTFGDSLPIEGLIEAANETARTGKVVGVLADALNWVSISEDEFNNLLAACTSESEKNRLIMSTLASTYDDASDAFYRNNQTLVESREAQSDAQTAINELGDTAAQLKTKIQSDFSPAIGEILTGFSDVIKGAPGAEEELSKAIGNLAETYAEKLPKYFDIGGRVVEAISKGMIENTPQIIGSMLSLMNEMHKVVRSVIIEIFKQIGISIVKGIGQGFESAIDWLKGIFTGGAKELTDATKDELDIHSPSGVFKDIGYNMAAGMGEGWASAAPLVSRAVNADLQSMGAEYGGSSFGGQNLVINLTAELDGAVLSHKMYSYNTREIILRGEPLVSIG